MDTMGEYGGRAGSCIDEQRTMIAVVKVVLGGKAVEE